MRIAAQFLVKLFPRKSLFFPFPSSFVPTSISVPTSSGTGQFVAHGVRQQQHQRPLARLDLDAVPEIDRLWVRLLAKAVAQCGNDPDRLVRHVRAVVEGECLRREFDA